MDNVSQGFAHNTMVSSHVCTKQFSISSGIYSSLVIPK